MTTPYHETYLDDSGDEIVWSPHAAPRVAIASSDPLITSGSQGRTSAFNLSLTAQMANLRISGTSKGSVKKQVKEPKPAVLQNAENHPTSTKRMKKAKKAKRNVGTTENDYPSPLPPPRANNTATKGKKEQRGNGSKTTKSIAPRSDPTHDNKPHKRPGVKTTSQDATSPSLYEEASTFISRFLSTPEAKNDSTCRLTLLQSLIIELGLATSNLPPSLTSARAFLKARAFLNIREYVAVRSQGPDAIRKAMYPSKSALLKTLRKRKESTAPLRWVKDMGLQVLLVGVH